MNENREIGEGADHYDDCILTIKGLRYRRWWQRLMHRYGLRWLVRRLATPVEYDAQRHTIQDYDPSTRVATIAGGWGTNPDAATVFTLAPSTDQALGQELADAGFTLLAGTTKVDTLNFEDVPAPDASTLFTVAPPPEDKP